MPSSAEPSLLQIDGRVPDERELRHVWSACLGAGRANEVLRADWQHHFREAVDVLGARYVRFHGVFHDDMFVYRVSDGGGFGPPQPLAEPLYTYSYVDKVFDAVLAAGARPFVELGFMPSELATQTGTVFWWKAHASPPQDMARWVELVSTTVRHWIERYGIDEVREWRFEVWNEPNLVPHFWTGTRTQYFELYEATARAIKDIDPRLRVGGPSTSVFVPDARYDGETEDRSAEVGTAETTDPDALHWKPVWIHEFVDWCATRDVPVDFLSTHLYPTDYAFDADGQGHPIERHVDATYDDLVVMRAIIDGSPFPDAELHISEWSSSPSSRDRMHDTLFAATYITRAFLRGAALADSISYWTFTDVFEEGGAGIGPFHGGFGLVNEQGIHKPTFHAMAMLARLGDRLLSSTPHGVVTRRSTDGAFAAVFFNYPDDMGTTAIGSRITYEATRPLADKGPTRVVQHTVGGLAPGTTLAVEVLDWDHGNVAEAWHQMGEPLNLTPQQTQRLRDVADGLHRDTLVVPDTGVLELRLELRPWAVVSVVQDLRSPSVSP
ncbi:GH39 family glycosyl hydrolase [Cellulomonas sp. URHB0016]